MGRSLFWAACLLGAAAPLNAQEPAGTVPTPLEACAELTDVSFVDRARGWVVGEAGLIWHTADGGKTWEKQASGVACRLERVQFLPDGSGWAAGGWAWPYASDTQGMVLSTRDEGQSWLPATGALPWVRHLRFTDAQNGWAVGHASELAPGAVYTTSDGGRVWNPRPLNASGDWLAADFGPQRGALLGSGGTGLRVDSSAAVRSTTPSAGLRRPRRLELADRRGWAVGDGGLVWTTNDAGKTWRAPSGKLPAECRGFDFRALALWGDHVWAAGFPGTHVLVSTDAGQTWRLLPTGQTLPINALELLDADHAVAVGALGTILATDDGGGAWRTCRQGAPRVAALGIFADGQALPLEFFGRIGGEGYPTAAHLVARREFDDPRAGPAETERARAALASVGGNSLSEFWQFPVRQRGLAIAQETLRTAWQRGAGEGAPPSLAEELAAVLRTWRPEIVVTAAAGAESEPLDAAIQQALLEAIELAAADVGPTARGGKAWQVQRVYAALPAGRLGPITLSAAAFVPGLGRSLADLSATGRGLLKSTYEPPAETVGFQLLYDRLGTANRQRDDFLLGLTVGELAAPAPPSPAPEVARLHRAATQQRNLRALLARSAKQPLADARWLAEVSGLIGELDRAAAGELLFQLAHGYHHQGRWDLASETFTLLAGNYADHPLSGPALVWLIERQTSAEARLRATARPEAEIQQTAASVTYGVDPSSLAVPATNGSNATRESPQRRAQQLAVLASQVARTRPGLAASPSLRFALTSTERDSSAERAAATFEAMLRTRPRDAWAECAASEVALLRGAMPSAQPVFVCRRAGQPPRLDGQLDDEAWQGSAGVKLTSRWQDDAEWPTQVRLAYDDRFLYLAARCALAPGIVYRAAQGQRPRDASLARHDRVELCLDVDRDRATWFQWSIDARGWTSESCWGDRSWNPTWYVAQRADEAEWTAEAAIAWADVSGAAPATGTVWAMGLQRVAPGAGFQSWTNHAAVDIVPAGFGLLRFE